MVSICVVVLNLFMLDMVILLCLFCFVIYLCNVEIMILWLIIINVGIVIYKFW